MSRAKLVTLVVLLSVFGPMSTTGVAQENQGGGLVAVLDLAKVFEAHPGHREAMARIEARAESMRKSFQEQQVSLQERAKNAANQFQGAQLNEVEIQLRQEEVKLQTTARQAQTELMKSEAEAFYKTHDEVMTILQQLCKKYNVSVVLRHDSEPIDPSRPETVIRGVQRSVVFAANDLTPHVLHELSTTASAPATATTNATSQPAPATRR